MDKCCSMQDRENLIVEIVKSIKIDKSAYWFWGNQGTGRKYTLNKIIDTLNTEDKKLRIMYFVGDSLVERNKLNNKYKVACSFEISKIFGVSFVISQEDNKINYILNRLKHFGIFNNRVLICVHDYDNLNSEAKEILNIIRSNINYFEDQLRSNGTKISYIIISKKESDVILSHEKNIEFHNYDKKDTEKYIKQICCNIIDNLPKNSLDKIINNIIKNCHTDFELITLCAHKFFECSGESLELKDIIEIIVNNKLKKLQEQGLKNYNISPGILEDLIITCALSITGINKNLIQNISSTTADIINSGLYLSTKSDLFLYNDTTTSYMFISEHIKDNLQSKIIDYSQYIYYYNYFSKFKNDEYLIRAYYLYKSKSYIDDNVYNLLILAISKDMLYNDISVILKIEKKFSNLNEQYKKNLKYFYEACKNFNANQYEQALKQLNFMDKYLLNNVGKAECERMRFKCINISRTYIENNILKPLETLKRFAIDSDLKLHFDNELYIDKKEDILILRIIFEIAPFILDTMNDIKCFELLYEKSKKLCNNNRNINSPFAEYVKNVFNRKAFLFVNVMQAESYYEEAEVYFYKTENWEQYVMTLSGKAGILIAQSNYKEAKNICLDIIKLIEQKQLHIVQEYKIYNNLYIAEFLEYEMLNLHNKLDIATKAKETINNLKKLYKNKKVSYVVYMNIASLLLYLNKIDEYEQVKKDLEKNIGCIDISDINDRKVDDFYSYRFAWLEIYKNYIEHNFSACYNIIENLKGYVPSLSYKQEVLWDKKLENAKKLIDNKQEFDAIDFCNKLYDNNRPSTYRMRFFYRGLPLSALQFTSLN